MFVVWLFLYCLVRQKNTYPEETSFNVVFSDVVDLAVDNQVEATFSLGLEKDYDKKYSENLRQETSDCRNLL